MKHFALCLFCLAGAGSLAAQPASSLPDILDINGAIRYSLDHNYAILQARESIRQQEGVIMTVKAQRLPNVTATGEYQKNAESVSQIYPPETTFWEVELKATEEIYAGGGIQSSIKNAQYVRDADVHQLQATINAALLDVRTKFYNVLLAREQVKVQEENIRLYQRQLTDSKHQFQAGTVSNFEVLRAEVALANAQPDLITARNNYRISIETLRQSLGVPAGGGPLAPFPEIVGELQVKPENFELETSLSTAHERRPEILQLGKLKNAGEENVTTAKSTYYPNLSAFAGYEYGGLTLANGGASPSASGWLLGVQGSWAIFDGRATAGRVAQAKSELNQNRLAYDSEELAIDVQVRQSLSSLEEAAELVSASKETVREADEALRLANARYHAGSATQLDVLTSQVSLTQARTNQLQAFYTYDVALATMHQAIGDSAALVGKE